MREVGDFLECAEVFGHAYGTSRQVVEAALQGGRDVILEIDWQGAAQVRRRLPGTVAIFLLPPSVDALAARLRKRAQDLPEVIAARAAQARSDMTHAADFDHIVVNDEFDKALADLGEIVQATREDRRPECRDHRVLAAALLS